MKKVSYYIALVIFLGASVVSLWVYQKYIKEEESKLLIFQVETGAVQEVVRVRGEVVAQKNFDLEFPFLGTVENVFVKEGQVVAKGDQLMKLETTDLDFEMGRLQAIYNQNGANLAKLVKGPTDEEVRVAKTKVNNAQAALNDAQKKLNSSQTTAAANFKAKKEALSDANLNFDNVTNKAKVDLQTVYTDAENLLNDALVKADNAMFGPIDELFYSAGTDQGSLMFASSNLQSSQLAELLYDQGHAELNKFKKELAEMPGDELSIDTELILAEQNLNVMKDFLQSLLTVVNLQINLANSATHLVNINTALSSVNSVISQINSQQQAISTQKIVNQNTVSTAEIKVNEAQNALNVQEVVDENLIVLAQAEANSAQSTLTLAKDNLNLLLVGTRSENIDIAKAQIQEIASQIALTQKKIEDSLLVAPLEAVVDKIWLEEQELSKVGGVVISLATFGQKIQADISELEIGKISDGSAVSLSLDAFPGQSLTGIIISVEPQEIVKEGDKYYRINVFLEPHGLEMRTGMSADLVINISQKENVVKIPEFTIIEKEGAKWVTLMEGDSLKEVQIKTGVSDGESIEVVSGVSEGQVIVISSE